MKKIIRIMAAIAFVAMIVMVIAFMHAYWCLDVKAADEIRSWIIVPALVWAVELFNDKDIFFG